MAPTPTSFTLICCVLGTLKWIESSPCVLLAQPIVTVSPR